MAERRQKIRGTTLELDQEIGLEGLLAYDTERNNLRAYDGINMGGYEILNESQIAALYTLPNRLTEAGISLNGLSANDATENGWYTTTATTTDLPAAAIGSLVVETADHSNAARTQVWTRTSTGEQHRRTFDGNITWTPWVRIVDLTYLTTDAAAKAYDADRLDGQDSTYYTNIVARLGYTPANKAGDTFTGNVAVGGTLGVTGAATLASTLVVNGNSISIVGSTPRLFLNDTDAADDDFWIMVEDNVLYVLSDRGDDGVAEAPNPLELDNTTSNGQLYGSKIWTQGNDGAGSLLDSDLLDGQHGAYYLGLANATGQLDIATKVTGVLAVANGGTGGATQAAARTGLGLGGLATLNFSDLVYTGSDSTNLAFPVGTTIGIESAFGTVGTVTSNITLYRNSSNRIYSPTAFGTALGGTWRNRGRTAYVGADNMEYHVFQRTV